MSIRARYNTISYSLCVCWRSFTVNIVSMVLLFDRKHIDIQEGCLDFLKKFIGALCEHEWEKLQRWDIKVIPFWFSQRWSVPVGWLFSAFKLMVLLNYSGVRFWSSFMHVGLLSFSRYSVFVLDIVIFRVNKSEYCSASLSIDLYENRRQFLL